MKNMTTNLLLSRTAKVLQTNPFVDVGRALIEAKYKYVATKNGRKFIPANSSNDPRYSNAIVRSAVARIAKVAGVKPTPLAVNRWTRRTGVDDVLDTVVAARKTK